jgi:hypothetical protein
MNGNPIFSIFQYNIKVFLIVLIFISPAKISKAQPANSPAPMFGLNLANTNTSQYVGITANPIIKWTVTHAWASRVNSPALILDSRGVLYSPAHSPVWAATGQPVSFLTMNFGDIGTPAIDTMGNIYNWDNERMHAYSANGTPLWTGTQTWTTAGYSPKISSDGTIFAEDGSGKVHAYSPNGIEKWCKQIYADNHSPPAIDAYGNTYYIAGVAYGNYVSFDINGNIRWTSPQNELWNYNPTMLGPDGLLYSSENYGTSVYVRDPNTGTILRHQSNLYGGIEAIGSDGTLYSASYHTVQATDPFGVIKWKATVPSTIFMSNLVADAVGQVFCTTEEDQLMAFSNTGTLLWSLQFPAGNAQSLPPVIGSDGSIFVLNGNQLIAIVPEPSSIELMLAGALCLLTYARQRRK